MIAVIGGAGYIGSHTVKLLIEQGREVVVFDNLSTGHREFIPSTIPFVKGDLSLDDDLQKLFSTFPTITTVIHFAAFAYVGESVINPAKYYNNNVVNTIRLLNRMLEHGVKQIVFSSTCATYGEPLELPISESHPQHPINPYGRTKRMIEQVMDDYSHAYGLNHIALRYFNAAGADSKTEIGEWHNPETHLIPLVLDVAMGKKAYIKVFGDDYDTKDGTCIRDYIHVTDLAQAHIKAVDYLHKEKKSNQFNLGNGNGYSVLEVIQTTEKVTGRKVPIQLVERREGDPAVLVGATEKAKQELGWSPSYTSLDEMISTAWKWHIKMNRE